MLDLKADFYERLFCALDSNAVLLRAANGEGPVTGDVIAFGMEMENISGSRTTSPGPPFSPP